jgi:hypothetical protein
VIGRRHQHVQQLAGRKARLADGAGSGEVQKRGGFASKPCTIPSDENLRAGKPKRRQREGSDAQPSSGGPASPENTRIGLDRPEPRVVHVHRKGVLEGRWRTRPALNRHHVRGALRSGDRPHHADQRRRGTIGSRELASERAAITQQEPRGELLITAAQGNPGSSIREVVVEGVEYEMGTAVRLGVVHHRSVERGEVLSSTNHMGDEVRLHVFEFCFAVPLVLRQSVVVRGRAGAGERVFEEIGVDVPVRLPHQFRTTGGEVRRGVVRAGLDPPESVGTLDAESARGCPATQHLVLHGVKELVRGPLSKQRWILAGSPPVNADAYFVIVMHVGSGMASHEIGRRPEPLRRSRQIREPGDVADQHGVRLRRGCGKPAVRGERLLEKQGDALHETRSIEARPHVRNALPLRLGPCVHHGCVEQMPEVQGGEAIRVSRQVESLHLGIENHKIGPPACPRSVGFGSA